MKRIAVIGLGIMGRGIARNFLKAGYEVTVWNRSSQSAEELASEGAVHAPSVAKAVAAADIVFEVTANDESSREMWLGENGIVTHGHPGQALITCATLSADWIDELAKACDNAALTFFDMPMTGGRVGAETGNLSLLVGGKSDKLAELEPILSAIASRVTYFGEAGNGTRYKLVLNALQAIHVAGFAEAMRIAIAAGLDPAIVGPALVERPGGVITELAWQGYQVQPEPINFSVEWIRKDLGYASQLAGFETPLIHEAITQYDTAIQNGNDQADWTIIASNSDD